MLGAALWIGPAIVAAVIAGLINIVGWSVTFRHTRRLDQERRAEKVIDIQTALLAEIRSDAQNFVSAGIDAEIASVERRMNAAQAGQSYTPFVPKDSGSPIFSAIVGDISLLPTNVIDPIVLYYKQRDAIAHFIDDLRGNRFQELPSERKLAMMADYLRLRSYAGSLATDAISALEASLGLPPSLNSKASARSDRESALGGSASVQPSSISDPREYRPD